MLLVSVNSLYATDFSMPHRLRCFRATNNDFFLIVMWTSLLLFPNAGGASGACRGRE